MNFSNPVNPVNPLNLMNPISPLNPIRGKEEVTQVSCMEIGAEHCKRHDAIADFLMITMLAACAITLVYIWWVRRK